MRLRLALLIAAVVIAAGVAVNAWASPAVNSRITIHELPPAGSHYKGRVFSSKGACVRGRRVQLWQRHPGADELHGTFSAQTDGRWTFAFIGDHYYVVARRTVVGSGSHAIVCKRARPATT